MWWQQSHDNEGAGLLTTDIMSAMARRTRAASSANGLDSLTGVAAFVRAAEARSFVAAGRFMGVSASAIGKNVARLEDKLGVRLFHRSTRSMTLTGEGELLLARCQRVLADLSDAEAELMHAREAPRGRLRVSLPAMCHRLLGPILPGFLRAYPDIELDFDYNDELVDVIDGGFDVVIRSGALADSRLMSRRLEPYRMLVVGAPRYLRRHRAPKRPVELASHTCLRYRFPTSGKLQPWALATDEPFTLGRGMACNSGDALLAAAVQGLGLAYLPDFGVRDELASGALGSVLDGHTTTPGVFHALWPANRLLSPKVRVFVDHLPLAA